VIRGGWGIVPGGRGWLLTGREGTPIRKVLVVTAIGWFLWVMLHGPAKPGFGLSGTDLVYTACFLSTVACLGFGLAVRNRDRSYDVALYAAAAGIGVLLCALAPDRPGSAILFVISGCAASSYRLWRSVGVVAIASIGITVTVLTQGRPAGELWTVVGLLGTFSGVHAGRLREEARRTEQQNLVLAERSHIAREIHDILAHSLSAQLVHLEGARLLIVGGRTGEALERVERARGLARSGLEETRRALAALRGDIPPIDEVLRELADEHRAVADARCEVTIAGDPREIPGKAGLAVIRTAQEALTNARKHAPRADVAIDLRYTGGWCELQVTDSGSEDRPGPLAASGGGYGLVGMRERAELIGGTLSAGPEGKGFRVLLRVPL
jgi:signal transduction histidine kinase